MTVEHRPRRDRWERRAWPSGDAGAATLETTGMWALGALLVVAVTLVLVGSAPWFGDTTRRAICMVVTLGEGDCGTTRTTAAEHRPQDPCVLQAQGHDSKVKGAFTFISASTGEQWMVETLSDGTFRVTRGENGSVGAEAGVGVTAQLTWDDKAYGVNASAGASAELGFRGGEVYAAKDAKAVAALLKQHGVDVAEDHVLGGSGPLRDAVDTVASWIGLGGYELPTPSDTYVEGGLTLSADAAATLVYAGAHAGVSSATVIGARVAHDGSSTEYLRSTVTGEVAAGTWGSADDGSTEYAQLKAQGSVQQVLELDRDAHGTVTAVRSRMVLSGEAQATGGSSGPSAKGYTERVTELPIRSGTDRAIAMRFLAASGVAQVSGLVGGPVTALAGPAAVLTAGRFDAAARARGTVTQQSFDASSSSYGGALGAEALGEVSGEVTVNVTNRSSTGGQYWDGMSWQPWSACG